MLVTFIVVDLSTKHEMHSCGTLGEHNFLSLVVDEVAIRGRCGGHIFY